MILRATHTDAVPRCLPFLEGNHVVFTLRDFRFAVTGKYGGCLAIFIRIEAATARIGVLNTAAVMG